MKAMSRKLVSATALYRAIKNNPTPNANVIIPLMAIVCIFSKYIHFISLIIND